jgi:hypothetical protein
MTRLGVLNATDPNLPDTPMNRGRLRRQAGGGDQAARARLREWKTEQSAASPPAGYTWEAPPAAWTPNLDTTGTPPAGVSDADQARQLVGMAVQTAARDRLDPARQSALLYGLDPARCLTDDGQVDTNKIRALIDSLDPPTWPDLGQGRRPGTVAGGVDRGAQLYRNHGRNRSSWT